MFPFFDFKLAMAFFEPKVNTQHLIYSATVNGSLVNGEPLKIHIEFSSLGFPIQDLPSDDEKFISSSAVDDFVVVTAANTGVMFEHVYF